MKERIDDTGNYQEVSNQAEYDTVIAILMLERNRHRVEYLKVIQNLQHNKNRITFAEDLVKINTYRNLVICLNAFMMYHRLPYKVRATSLKRTFALFKIIPTKKRSAKFFTS